MQRVVCGCYSICHSDSFSDPGVGSVDVKGRTVSCGRIVIHAILTTAYLPVVVTAVFWDESRFLDLLRKFYEIHSLKGLP